MRREFALPRRTIRIGRVSEKDRTVREQHLSDWCACARLGECRCTSHGSCNRVHA
jgi:hypothetical protein